MKIRDNRNVESTFGDQFESTNFTAEVGGKFFDIVLDKLYTNKPRSIIRELSTNAYDSHVQAGKADVPFFVQIPTALDATFTVRDYGVSLTHEEVMHLYTTVFSSTKTNSNDLVGAFGLGSKTPFAYTDAFTVTAWLDGEKRVYVATRGADGTPSLSHLTTEKSDEPQGFSVSFPVQEQDFYRFKAEAAVVFEGFDVKPECPGLTVSVQTPLFEGENWTVTARSSHAIRQGCVIYPLHDEIEFDTKLAYGYGLTVTVPIGTASVAANREALSLDDETIANVSEALQSASKELESQVGSFLLDAPDLFEANVRWEKLNQFFDVREATYHGQILNGVIEFPRNQANTVEHIATHKLKAITGKVSFPVESAAGLVFLVDRTGNDVPRKLTRIREWVKGQRRADGRVFIVKDPTSAQLGALVRRLHLAADQIVSVAALPDVEIVRAPRSTRDNKGPVQGVYTLQGRDVTEIEDDYLYVEIERVNGDWAKAAGNLFDVGYWTSRHGVQSALVEAANTVGETRPIYALTAGAVKRYKPKASQNFHTVVESWAKNNRRTIQRQLKIHTAVSRVKYSVRSALNNWQGIPDEGIDKILARLAPSCTSFGFDNGTAQLLNRLDPAAYAAAVEQGESFALKAQERYPLLFSPDGDDILRYIQSNPRKRKGA